MSVKRPIQFLFLAFCVFISASCARKASDEIDFGTVEKSVYSNKYFGFSLALPADWSVQDQESRQRLSEAGSKMMAGDDRRMKAILKASEQQSVNLFAVFKHPLGTPVTFNQNVICMAERLGGLSGVKSGKDYHFHARRLMESSQVKINFERDLSVENLGGVDFDVMHGSITVGSLTVHQKYYAAVLKKYALVFITSYNTPDQQTSVQNILRTLAFNEPSSPGPQTVNARTPSTSATK